MIRFDKIFALIMELVIPHFPKPVATYQFGAFFEKRPARKYQGQTLLVFRTLTSKLATMGTVMAVISVIFTATLLTEGSGLVFNGIFRGRAAETACFDLYFGIEGKNRNPGSYLEYIDESRFCIRFT